MNIDNMKPGKIYTVTHAPVGSAFDVGDRISFLPDEDSLVDFFSGDRQEWRFFDDIDDGLLDGIQVEPVAATDNC